MAAAFGADLLLLKAVDVQKLSIGGIGEINHLSQLRELTGTGIGLNLEIADGIPTFKQVNRESIQEAISKGADFLSLTA